MTAWRNGLLACGRNIRATFSDHLPLYICAALFYGLTLLCFALYDFPLSLKPGLFFLRIIGICLMLWLGLLAAGDLFKLWRSGAPKHPLTSLLRSMMARLQTGDRMGNSFHALLTLTPMMIVFAGVKDKISAINPFAWDPAFEAWDRALSFGYVPWEILQPVLGYAPITIGLGFLYGLWFVLMFGLLIWHAFSAASGSLEEGWRRLQFLLAFGFSWFIGGSVLAIVFSSAGPCFYHHIVDGPSPYAAQMTYLQSIGEDWLWALKIQNLLWTNYTTGEGMVGGISAMPSMHVTIATLLAFSGWSINRIWGWLLSLFAVSIMLGSVHLAWHYAVDGLAGIIIAALCWYSAGWIARRWLRAMPQQMVPNGAELQAIL